MKIISWNVNGLRSCANKGFLDWLNQSEAAVVGLQEVRALPEQLPTDVREPEGWHTHFFPAERKGYSGVGLYARQPLTDVITTIGVEEFDIEGRVQIAQIGLLTVVNVYFPNGNGKNRDLSRTPYKHNFYIRLREILTPRALAGERILVMGDFNTAHEDIDIARPRANDKTSGFLPEDRASFQEWLTEGWTDTFRHFNTEPHHYSWWSNRAGVREKNIGWRIDYILASPAAMQFVQHAQIHPDVLGSDHCPVSVTLNPAVTE